MKKLLLMAAVLGFTGGVNAADAEVDACEGIERFTGLYIGAGFGGSFVKQSFNASEATNNLLNAKLAIDGLLANEDLFAKNTTDAKIDADTAFDKVKILDLYKQLKDAFGADVKFLVTIKGKEEIIEDSSKIEIGFKADTVAGAFGEVQFKNITGEEVVLRVPVTQSSVDFSSTSNRFLGTAVFGGGKVFNKFYVGAEAMFDFTKNSSKNDCADKEYYRICANGFTPTVAVRLGGYVPMLKSMLYIKAGAALVRPSFESSEPAVHNGGELSYEKTTVSYSNLVPVFGLGFERAFGRKLTARLDADYRLSKSRTEQYENHIALGRGAVGAVAAGGAVGTYQTMTMSAPATVKFKDKGGFTVRLMLQYHV